MILTRILPVTFVLTAAVSAQLPPSAVRPGQPRPVAPATPGVPGVPATPGLPAVPAAPAPMAPLPPLSPTIDGGVPSTPPLPAPPPMAPPPGGIAPGTPIPFGDIAPTPSASLDMSSPTTNALTAAEQAQGWKLLFDGVKLVGFKGVQKPAPLTAGWIISEGALDLPKAIRDTDRMTGGDLITTDAYIDFDFRFEWRTATSANSGIRYMLTGLAAGQTPSGLEFQIIDDVHSPIGLKGGRIRQSGALDNVLPPNANAQLRSADPLNHKGDQWNEGRILVQGNRVEHWMNGQKVLEFNLGPQLKAIADRNAVKGSRPLSPYFGTKVKTQICILDEGTEVAFRNLKIRPLAPAGTAPQPGTATTTPGATGTRPSAPDPFNLPKKR